MSDQTNWRVNLKVSHPAFNEPKAMREARVVRTLDAFLQENEDELDEKFVAKLRKSINVRMLAIMDEVRDASTPE